MTEIFADMTADTDIDRIVADWLAANLGTVTRLEREGRWRPVWYADVERDGEVLPLFIRGDRGGRWPPMPLSYEAIAQGELERQGLKVPKIYGFIETFPAIVMERVPGRPNLATADNDEARQAVLEQLVDQMRMMHNMDPAKLVAAGFPNPQDRGEMALASYRQVEKIYLEGDRLPSPDVEFVRKWLNRNVPPCPDAGSVIAMDAGQFIFEGSELTALMDFEFIGLGDHHTDFGALRTRTKIEPLGDLADLFRLYEARGGKPIDIDRVRYHSVAFSLFTPLEIAHDLAHPRSAADYNEYVMWWTTSIKDALEGIAEIEGYELQPFDLPAPTKSRSAMSIEAIEEGLEQLPLEGDYATYRRDSMVRALRFLHRREAYRAQFERAYCDEVEALIGTRPVDEWDADVKLEAFVQAAPPELDEAILHLLHRRVRRTAPLLAEEGTYVYHSLLTPLEPLRAWR